MCIPIKCNYLQSLYKPSHISLTRHQVLSNLIIYVHNLQSLNEPGFAYFKLTENRTNLFFAQQEIYTVLHNRQFIETQL